LWVGELEAEQVVLEADAERVARDKADSAEKRAKARRDAEPAVSDSRAGGWARRMR